MPLPLGGRTADVDTTVSATGQCLVNEYAPLGSNSDLGPRLKMKDVARWSTILQPAADLVVTAPDNTSAQQVMSLTTGSRNSMNWTMWLTGTIYYQKTAASGTLNGGITFEVTVLDFYGNPLFQYDPDLNARGVPANNTAIYYGSPRKTIPSSVSASSYTYEQFHRFYSGHVNSTWNAAGLNSYYTWVVNTYKTGVDASATYTIPASKCAAILWIFDI